MEKTALIVEDHPLYRGALMFLMERIFGAPNVTAASSVEEGLALVEGRHDLALVMLDLGLPGLNGVEAVATFRRKCPAATILVVSASEDRREANAAIKAGAMAFVSKAVSTEVISKLVERVLAGELTGPEWVTAHAQQGVFEDDSVALTPRQHEILILLSHGHSNKEISLRLGLAEITVKFHVSSIFRALGVVNRTQAVLAARRLGLYSPQQE